MGRVSRPTIEGFRGRRWTPVTKPFGKVNCTTVVLQRLVLNGHNAETEWSPTSFWNGTGSSPDDSGKEGNTSICSFFLLLFFTFSEVIDGHVWPHYTMRSWPGRPAASVRGRWKCKWGSNWNRWSLRSMVGRWLGGINSLRTGGENDGSANSPPAFSHINSSRKVSPTKPTHLLKERFHCFGQNNATIPHFQTPWIWAI